MKKIFLLITLISLISTSIVQGEAIKNQENDKAIIIGIVQSTVTCVPEPIDNATVKAEKKFTNEKEEYITQTDSNGEFELIIPEGIYKITAEKKKYEPSLSTPFYIKKVEKDNTYELVFNMLPSNDHSRKVELRFFIRIINLITKIRG